MFTPIAFVNKKIWTPAEIVKYWWIADAGVTISGSVVTSWEDQVSGKLVTQTTASRFPTLRNIPALNNQKSISFNNNWLIGTPLSFANEGFAFSYFVVFDDNDTGQNSIIAQSGDGGGIGRLAMGHITSTTNLQSFSPNFTTTQAQTLLASTPTGSHYVAWDYNASGSVRGWADDFTTPAINLSGGSNDLDIFQSTSLLFGAYNGNSPGSVNQTWNYSGSIAEIGFKVGTLSGDDLTNLEDYIKNKYGF